ncbi:MAG: rhombosortase [Gammaproteobacteria bacterium]|nr:rhombosortase [Gammaproteobacteria bacterium]
MGLNQGDQSHSKSGFLAAWLLPLLALAIAVAIALLGDSGREWLSFDRPALASGELWRLVSGHFVHLGLSHLILNSAGLLLIWYLIFDAFSRSQWLIVSALVVASIDLGFWFLEPQLVWYVGLSGLLHGLLAAGVLVELKPGRPEMWLLAIGLVAKLLYEQLIGPLPGSEESSGGNVIVAAHAYGAIGGVLAALMIRNRVRRHASL